MCDLYVLKRTLRQRSEAHRDRPRCHALRSHTDRESRSDRAAAAAT